MHVWVRVEEWEWLKMGSANRATVPAPRLAQVREYCNLPSRAPTPKNYVYYRNFPSKRPSVKASISAVDILVFTWRICKVVYGNSYNLGNIHVHCNECPVTRFWEEGGGGSLFIKSSIKHTTNAKSFTFGRGWGHLPSASVATDMKMWLLEDRSKTFTAFVQKIRQFQTFT